VFVELFILKFGGTLSESFLLNILEKADFFLLHKDIVRIQTCSHRRAFSSINKLKVLFLEIWF